MALHGDIEVSTLRRKPAGRQPVLTRVLPARRLGEVVDACGRALGSEARIFWICPMIEEDDQGEAGAESRYEALRERFGALVGIAHGNQRPREREGAMRAFAEGRTRILVATTVVEVGVDVPEATIIVVEGADRFGLAQLHQLRGRVGRGSDRAACLLLYGQRLSNTGRERLRAIRRTTDGFAIADADLRLRGPGEILGTRQSGLPAFRLAVLPDDQPLLEAARIEAAQALTADPGLESARGRALRLLLHLFERDDALDLIAAG
jgi:ATP-dependent DNA helicase RecG